MFALFSPVLLADKQVEGILGPQKVVIIQNFYCTHPVGIEITSNLSKNMKWAEESCEQHKRASKHQDDSRLQVYTALFMNRDGPTPNKS